MLTVTGATDADAPAIAKLLQEMDDFYGESSIESTDAKLEQLSAVLFSNTPLAYALLARDASQAVGLAAYSFLWPAVQSTKSLYLKELYVSKSYRRGGVGRLLMRRICEVAINHHCSRVEWTTDHDNKEARQFYEDLGFASLSSKVFYRIEGQDALCALSGDG